MLVISFKFLPSNFRFVVGCVPICTVSQFLTDNCYVIQNNFVQILEIVGNCYVI